MRPLYLLLFLSLSLSLVNAQDATSCEGLPESRLVAGEQGWVLPGEPNNLRLEPTTESDIITEIPADALFHVIEGPECSEDFAWWQVGYSEFVGWTVENIDEEAYAVEPITPTTTSISFGGVSFEMDSRIAVSATGQVIPAVSAANPDLPFWSLTPTFINFALDEQFDNPGTMARIAVYPAQELGDVQQTTALVELETLLESQPPNPSTLPMLPIVNAERVFVSQMEYLDFEGGSGVRFVVYLSQAADPLTSGSLWYVFQGLTERGEHYIQVYLPLVTRLFPPVIGDDFDYDSFVLEYDRYLDTSQQTVDEAESSDFAPMLAILDAMVESIQIDPIGVSATFAGDTSLTVRCEITAIEDTRLRSEPDVNAAISDFLPRNTTVIADGQFQRRGENFPWWRLSSSDGVRPVPGVTSLPGSRWIRADFTFEDGNCAGLPVIDSP